MKKILFLLLTFALLVSLFAGCATNAEPGDNTRDGIIGGTTDDTDRNDHRWEKRDRNMFKDDYKDRQDDYDVTDGTLTDRNKNNTPGNKNDDPAGRNTDSNTTGKSNGQNVTDRAS